VLGACPGPPCAGPAGDTLNYCGHYWHRLQSRKMQKTRNCIIFKFCHLSLLKHTAFMVGIRAGARLPELTAYIDPKLRQHTTHARGDGTSDFRKLFVAHHCCAAYFDPAVVAAQPRWAIRRKHGA